MLDLLKYYRGQANKSSELEQGRAGQVQKYDRWRMGRNERMELLSD
jgi:hypothetical protein